MLYLHFLIQLCIEFFVYDLELCQHVLGFGICLHAIFEFVELFHDNFHVLCGQLLLEVIDDISHFVVADVVFEILFDLGDVIITRTIL